MYEKKPWLKFYGQVPHTLEYPRVSMYEAVRLSAEEKLDDPAYDFMGHTSTYRRFMEEIDHCADALAAIGVKKGDTILFNQVEQEPSWHVVPDSLQGNRFSIIKLMVQDTISIPAIFIRALPLKALFENEFVTKEIPDDAYERARQNLEAEALKEELRMRPADAHTSQQMLAQSRANELYYYKQAPPQNYFSPTAWMQFLESWKRGDFKKKPAQKKPKYISPY
jgi:hypothetical protein